MVRAFRESGKPALMTVLRNKGKWDKSNVIFAGGDVTLYDKRPEPETADRMAFIDYGLAVLRRSAVAERIPSGVCYDLARFYHSLSVEGQLAGFEVGERFYEIGSLAGFNDFTQYLLKLSR